MFQTSTLNDVNIYNKIPYIFNLHIIFHTPNKPEHCSDILSEKIADTCLRKKIHIVLFGPGSQPGDPSF